MVDSAFIVLDIIFVTQLKSEGVCEAERFWISLLIQQEGQFAAASLTPRFSSFGSSSKTEIKGQIPTNIHWNICITNYISLGTIMTLHLATKQALCRQKSPRHICTCTELTSFYSAALHNHKIFFYPSLLGKKRVLTRKDFLPELETNCWV